MGRAFAVYTALRVVLFAVCCGVLLVLGAPRLVGVAVALLVSSLLSLIFLRRQRDVFVLALQRRREDRANEQARLRGLLDDGPSANEQTGR